MVVYKDIKKHNDVKSLMDFRPSINTSILDTNKII